MEGVELSARLSRLLRANGDATPSAEAPVSTRSEVRDVLEAVVAYYDDGSVAPATSVDDMLLMALQRLLLTTLREYDSSTQERAFAALKLLLQRCQDRLSPAFVVELLQSCVLFLPTPTAAVSSSGSTDDQQTSEELRLLIVQAMLTLLSSTNAPSAVQLLTHSQDHVHFLAYVVSCLLQLAERERNRGLAVVAIDTLSRLLDCVAPSPLVLRQFFPGVSVGMWRTMSAPLQSSRVVVAALECLSTMISRCLSDKLATNTSVKQATELYSVERLRELQYSSAAATDIAAATTDSWLVQSADKIDLLLSQLFASKSIDQHTWRVRRALVDLCGVVVLECRSSLHASFFRCFEELMVLQTHAIVEIAEAASGMMQRLQAELPLDEWLVMEPQFAERFQMQLSTLALKCSTEHESACVHLMEILIGYLQFQGHRLQSVLDDAMPSIYKALSHVVAFESMDVDLLRHEHLQLQTTGEDNSAKTTQKSIVLPYFRKLFRHFHDEIAVSVALRLLRALGTVATPAAVVDTAFSLLMDSDGVDVASERESVLIVLNETLRAHVADGAVPAATSATQDKVHLVGRVLDDLLALPLWSSTRSSDKNTVALMVECVGVCVDLTGGAFEDFLIYALYPLVEKLGDHFVQVSRAALTTLQKIAFHCGYNSDLQALFSTNMDYFVDALCARLEHLDAYPQSPLVVEALLQHATVASLPLTDEITRSLLRAVDLYQDDPMTTSVLLRSLQLLLQSFANDASTEEAEQEKSGGMQTSALTRFLLEIRVMTDPMNSETPNSSDDETKGSNSKLPSAKGAMPVEFDGYREREQDDEGDEEDAHDDDVDDDKEPAPLPFQAQTIEILERCSYFVADSDPAACCLVLKTIEQGVRYLEKRRKELLPLIHRLWPSILHRLTVTNRPILTATVQLLTTLAECVGDFIGDRFVETVWPAMEVLLASIAENSASKGGEISPSVTRAMLLLSVEGSSAVTEVKEDPVNAPSPVSSRGRMTLEAKLLDATLRCLRTVCQRAVTVTSLVPTITAACMRFLDPQFPPSTISLAEELLMALGSLNGDEVFVALASLAEWQPPRTPSSRFPSFNAGVCNQSIAIWAPNTTSSRGVRRKGSESIAWQQNCRQRAAFLLEKLQQRP